VTDPADSAAIMAVLARIEAKVDALAAARLAGDARPGEEWPPDLATIDFEDGNWVPPKEAATRLNYDPDTITSWCNALPIAVQVGRQWKVNWPRLLQFMVVVPDPLGKIGMEALPRPPMGGDDPVELNDGKISDG
jgi:hypothetical protein